MSHESGGTDVLGIVSLITAGLGLIGQGCCCIPIISMLAMLVVPLCIFIAIATGAAGIATGMGSGRSTALSWMGLALGLFDIAFLCLWYGALICGYLGIVIASGAANA